MLQPMRGAIKYVYDLPYTERMELCRILDQNDKWEILGGRHMDFDMLTIQDLRREIWCGRSPTDALLTRWGHQNHTILELFVHLSKMQHYQAMLTIKRFVDVEYHRLIYEGEANLSRIIKRPSAPPLSEATNSNVNFNLSTTSNVMPCKMDGVSLDSESKILNVDGAPRTSDVLTAVVTSGRHNNNNHNIGNNNNANSVVDNQRQLASSPSALGSRDRTDVSLGMETVGLPMIPFKELEMATKGWDPVAMLGKGGFGTVYRGLWKNTPVAVKRTRATDTGDSQGVQIQQILGELKNLNAYRHDNILPLYGYSVGGDDPCLIYQLMPNGSLEDRLLCRQGSAPLLWGQRLSIAVGTARGLQFLHTINDKPLIHGDIKSANILLDSNFQPKIGDFGLAREGPQSQYTHMKVSRVHGTRPYLPDEFLRAKKFSTKVDTHSFGVVLFELATGLRAYDEQRTHKFLRDLIDNSDDAHLATFVDRKAGPEEPHTFGSLIDLGKLCVSRRPKNRPEMVQVLQELEGVSANREKMLIAQTRARNNSLTPSNPYERQVLFDHWSQQRNISPSVSPVADRKPSPSPIYASPVQQPFPPSVESNHPFQEINGNRKAFSPVPSTSSGTTGMFPTVIPATVMLPATLSAAAPTISVSPPSNQTNTATSSLPGDEGISQQQSQQFQTDENSSYSCILPLISELGIKKSDGNESESAPANTTAEEESSGFVAQPTSSAKGKSLWILGDSG